jgi:hypothetical protein
MHAIAAAVPTPASTDARAAADPVVVRRASTRVMAAVALGLVVLSAVFTGTGSRAASADEHPGSGVVLLDVTP